MTGIFPFSTGTRPRQALYLGRPPAPAYLYPSFCRGPGDNARYPAPLSQSTRPRTVPRLGHGCVAVVRSSPAPQPLHARFGTTFKVSLKSCFPFNLAPLLVPSGGFQATVSAPAIHIPPCRSFVCSAIDGACTTALAGLSVHLESTPPPPSCLGPRTLAGASSPPKLGKPRRAPPYKYRRSGLLLAGSPVPQFPAELVLRDARFEVPPDVSPPRTSLDFQREPCCPPTLPRELPGAHGNNNPRGSSGNMA